MKISEYIQHLQKLKNKYGDLEVKVNKTYECSDLSINDTFEDAKKPFYDEKQKCVVVLSEFYGYD